MFKIKNFFSKTAVFMAVLGLLVIPISATTITNANFDYAKEYDLWLTRADVNYGDYPEAHNNFLENGNPYRTFKQYETEDGAYYSGYYYLVN